MVFILDIAMLLWTDHISLKLYVSRESKLY